MNLGTDTLHLAQTQLTLTGTVVDCNSGPVDSGYVNVPVDGLNYRAAVVGGSFTLPVYRCYSSNVPAKLTAADLSTQKVGASVTVIETAGKVNVGQLSACPQP